MEFSVFLSQSGVVALSMLALVGLYASAALILRPFNGIAYNDQGSQALSSIESPSTPSPNTLAHS
jgi:hypothetical protein